MTNRNDIILFFKEFGVYNVKLKLSLFKETRLDNFAIFLNEYTNEAICLHEPRIIKNDLVKSFNVANVICIITMLYINDLIFMHKTTELSWK